MVNGNRPLAVIAGIAIVFLLNYAAEFFIPLFLAILISYALSRPRDVAREDRALALARRRDRRLTIVSMVALAAWGWSDDAQEHLPAACPWRPKTISKSLQKYVKPGGTITEVKKSAVELENVASTGKTAPPPAQAQAPSQNSRLASTLWQVVGTGARGVSQAGGPGDGRALPGLLHARLRRPLQEEAPRHRRGAQTRSASPRRCSTASTTKIRSYLLVMLIANVHVGAGVWLSFWALGVKYSGLWGVMAAILHTAPYFGPALIAAGSLVASFVQFGEWAARSSSRAHPSRSPPSWEWSSPRGSRAGQTRMNTTATFIGLLFFGWLWGFLGILLAIPLLGVVKVICEANEEWETCLRTAGPIELGGETPRIEGRLLPWLYASTDAYRTTKGDSIMNKHLALGMPRWDSWPAAARWPQYNPNDYHSYIGASGGQSDFRTDCPSAFSCDHHDTGLEGVRRRHLGRRVGPSKRVTRIRQDQCGRRRHQGVGGQTFR